MTNSRRNPRTGTEPNTARSALGMRRGLAIFGLVTCSALVGWLVVIGQADSGGYRVAFWVLAGIAALGAIVAVFDLVVIQRRMRN